MRRSAFVGVLAAGVLASGWFAVQPLADPNRPAPARAVAGPDVAQPALQPIVAMAADAPASVVLPELPQRVSALSSNLQAALLEGGCLSETEAMTRIIDVTAGADHYTAFAAVREVSGQEHPCGAIEIALGRSRGAFEQSIAAPDTSPPTQAPPFFGDGEPVGGGGGPGYTEGT